MTTQSTTLGPQFQIDDAFWFKIDELPGLNPLGDTINNIRCIPYLRSITTKMPEIQAGEEEKQDESHESTKKRTRENSPERDKKERKSKKRRLDGPSKEKSLTAEKKARKTRCNSTSGNGKSHTDKTVEDGSEKKRKSRK